MANKSFYKKAAVQLKDGFYIEVCDLDSKQGMKIRSDTRKAMDASASLYGTYKKVDILGEYKNGSPVIETMIK